MTRATALLLLAAGCATSAPRPPAPAAAAGAPRSAAPAAKPAGAPAPAPAEALPPRAQRLFAEAVQSIEDQKKLHVPTDWALVERKLRNALDAADFAEGHFDLGVALERQGKLADARAEYERALALKPSLYEAAVNLAVLREREGDTGGAAAAYAAAIRTWPEDAVARERLAALYLSAGQLDDAWRLAREALQRDPRAIVAYEVLARVALQRNQLDLAKLVAMKAQKLDASDPDVAVLTGQILAKQGDDAGAKAQWQKAIALRPDDPTPRYALLDAAVKAESWGAVAAQAQAILAHDPGAAPVQLALGVALRHLGKPDEALAAYAAADRLSGGKLPEVHLARGVLLMKVKNECEPAVTEFEAYTRVVGPTRGADAANKLRRECDDIIRQNREAAEAARQMQAEAQRKAADAAKGTAAPNGAAAPTSAPSR